MESHSHLPKADMKPKSSTTESTEKCRGRGMECGADGSQVLAEEIQVPVRLGRLKDGRLRLLWRPGNTWSLVCAESFLHPGKPKVEEPQDPSENEHRIAEDSKILIRCGDVRPVEAVKVQRSKEKDQGCPCPGNPKRPPTFLVQGPPRPEGEEAKDTSTACDQPGSHSPFDVVGLIGKQRACEAHSEEHQAESRTTCEHPQSNCADADPDEGFAFDFDERVEHRANSTPHALADWRQYGRFGPKGGSLEELPGGGRSLRLRGFAAKTP